MGDSPTPEPTDETLSLLRKTVSLLERIAEQLGQPATTARLLTKSEVARRLGVSTRWVERHLTPTAQPTRRGRAWYSETDVEQQLASQRRDTEARVRSAPRRVARERQRPVARDGRATEIEAELRAQLARRR